MSRAGCLVVTAWLAGSSWIMAQEPPATPTPAVAEQPPAPVAEQPSAPVAEVPPPVAGPRPPVTVAPPTALNPWLPAETEITIDKGTQVRAGIGFGGPIGAAASLRLMHGLGADVQHEDGRVKAVCAVPIPHCAEGFTVQADAGSGGGKLSLGVGARAHVEDEGFRGTVGAGLRLSVARTWGHPIGTDPGLTYLGPELDLSVLRVNLNLGVLWRVSGPGGASALFSWGLGFGL